MGEALLHHSTDLIELVILKPTLHYLRTKTKQGRNDEKTMYSEQCIVGVCHVSQTGFSPYAVPRICVEVAVSLTNTKEIFVKKNSQWRICLCEN